MPPTAPARSARRAVRLVLGLALLASVAAGCILPPGVTTTPTGAQGPDLAPYRGLGTWVDVYDYLAPFQANGRPPPVTPASTAALAWAGVDTLYLQVAKDDPRTPGDLVDPDLVGRFLQAAQRRGIAVVAWYLPTFADPARDMARLRAMYEFRYEGHRFDGIAVDIEERSAVPDVAERNRRLVELSRGLRQLVGPAALGAIVVPPVVTDIINTAFWPSFPWAELAGLYDIWLPMGYWTNRTRQPEWRDAGRYTSENIRLLRGHVGANALVHAIGGIGDASTVADYQGFLAAARTAGAVGVSIYDAVTTSPSAWPVLRAGAPPA
ncbi:MAG: hypothetical protein IPM45_00530 [Acidimicrobiales bacterium]|nr:hypothetical protein [Acidimicrobiales bacterium]